MEMNVKLTMLGVSGTGKTCYMIAMYGMMNDGEGLNGFTVSSDEGKAGEINERWDKMLDSQQGQERWPLPTNPGESVVYNFNLHFGNQPKPIIGFDWYEYRGGALLDFSDTSGQEVNQLRKRLQDSSSIMICLSGQHLLESDKLRVRAKRKMGVGRINEFIRESLNAGNNIPPSVVITITKYDLCRYESKEDLLKEIKEMFPPLFSEKTQWLVMVCPVTLGYELAAEPNDGEIKPSNLHYPIIFSLYAELVRKLWEMDDKLDKGSRELQTINKSDIKRFLERNKTFKRKESLNEISKLANSIQNSLNLMAEKIDMEQEITIFFDGNEVTFSEYLQ
jgi:GTPase SAR1 family protein